MITWGRKLIDLNVIIVNDSYSQYSFLRLVIDLCDGYIKSPLAVYCLMKRLFINLLLLVYIQEYSVIQYYK